MDADTATILAEPTVLCGRTACENTFPMDPSAPKVYCSAECRQWAKKQRQKEARAAKRQEQQEAGLLCPCAQCGSIVTLDKPKENPAVPSFCNDVCEGHHKKAIAKRKQKNKNKQQKKQKPNKNTITKSKCRNCSQETVSLPGKAAPNYCSAGCQEAVHDKRRAKTHQKRMETKESVCVECDKVFKRAYNDSFSYCSGSCRNLHLRKIAIRKNTVNRNRCITSRGKYRYDSPFHAQEIVEHHTDDVLNIYPCLACGAYHIGHLRGYELESVPSPRTYFIYKKMRKMGFLPDPSNLKKKEGPKHRAEKQPVREAMKNITLNSPKHRK